MDLIRLLLIQQETEESPPELEQYDQNLIVYNAVLMHDAGLIEAHITTGPEGTPENVAINRLTWAGHDFLDSSRDPSIWAKAKEKVLKPGVSWSFSILTEYLKAEAKQKLGAWVGMPPLP